MKTEAEIRKFMAEYPNNIAGLSYPEFVTVCNTYFPHLPISIVEFDNSSSFFGHTQYGSWNLVYRAQEITDASKSQHHYVSELSFVPKDRVDNIKSFGRANKKNEAMFYGALKFPTACIETLFRGENFKRTQSAWATVGIWRFTGPLVFAQIPPSKKYTQLFRETVAYKSKNITEAVVNERHNHLRGLLTTDFDLELFQFFGDAFANFEIDSEEDYYLSNYFTDRVFGRIPGFDVIPVDGILYPSIPNSYEELNIVLTPEIASSNLKFVEAMRVWCVNHPKSGVQFIPVEQGAYADETGKINWRRNL